MKQTRSTLSQLLEYRHFDGSSEDRLCLVTNAPISDARERFLRTLEVAVLVLDGAGFQAVGPLAQEWFAALIGGGRHPHLHHPSPRRRAERLCEKAISRG